MHKWLGLIGQEAVARVVRVSFIGGELGDFPHLCRVLPQDIPGIPGYIGGPWLYPSARDNVRLSDNFRPIYACDRLCAIMVGQNV